MKQARRERTFTVDAALLPIVEKTVAPFQGEEKLSAICKRLELSDEALNKVKVALRALIEAGEELDDTALFDMARQIASAIGYMNPEQVSGEKPMADDPNMTEKEEDEVTAAEEDEEKTPLAEEENTEEEVSAAEEEEESMAEKQVSKAANELTETKKALADTRKELDALRKSHDSLAVKLAAGETARRLGELTTKAEKTLSRVGKADDIASLMMVVESKCGEAIAKQLETVLVQAQAAIEEGAVFKELGSGLDAHGGNDAWAKIEKLALAVVEKSATPINKAAAIDAVLRTPEGAKLYDEYCETRQ